MSWAGLYCGDKKDEGSSWGGSMSFWKGLKPFTYSYTQNKFVVIGCNVFAYIHSYYDDPTTTNMTGCASVCVDGTLGSLTSCIGKGCCEAAIPQGLNFYRLSMSTVTIYGSAPIKNACSRGLIAENSFMEYKRLIAPSSNSLSYDETVPVVMDWAIGNNTCREAQRNKSSYVCGVNSHCVDSENGPGYKCKCSQGYRGNPYLRHGCQDIDECEENSNKSICRKEAHCVNTPGSYKCQCPHGYIGNGKISGIGCRSNKQKLPVPVIISLGIGIGATVVLILAFGFWLHRRLENRKKDILKQIHFKKNGGLLLKQRIGAYTGTTVEKAKIFGIDELERVTDNFNQSRILGKGGFGTVYKGMLPDGKIVAIKKSILVDERQVDQFINEVAILSQINHRHIVKLLGCCLETQVPLLVYEFVSNGTISQHLHSVGSGSSTSWKGRLRIAAEIAGALAYLHSDASMPIFHRDIKTSNILLDESYRAKVSDFGLSRSVPLEDTHLTTQVRGTFGYLDPEYFNSGKFTDKSDVYSFGVVLVELLTGERAVSLNLSEEGKSLVTHFTSSMKENRLYEIIESRVSSEGDKDEVMVVANLAKQCLKLNGKKRPVMKEVAATLDRLRRVQEQLPAQVQQELHNKHDHLPEETLSSRCTTLALEEDDLESYNSIMSTQQ